MSRVLIALAALLFIGAALTSPGEAQGSWTCTLNFTQGIPSGWTNNATDPFTVTGSGLYRTAGYGVLDYTGPATTFTSVSMTVSAAGTSSYRHVATVPSPYYINQNNTWLGAGTNTFSASGFSASALGFAYNPGNTTGYLLSATITGTGTNPCPATPTPIPPTATHTPIPATATATLVPTATNTPIAYPTDAPFVGSQTDSYWGNTYNMAYGLQGWSLISGMIGAGRVVSADVSGTQRLEMSYPLTNVRLNDLLVNYTSNGCTHTFEVRDGNTVFEAGTVGSGPQLIDWQGDHVMVNGTLVIALIGRPGCSVSSFELTEIFISGYGTNPTNLQATAVAFNTGNIWSGLQDANTMLNTLPQSFAGSVPPETGRALFGYVKWIVSPSSADEIAGPFAPVISHIGFALLIMFGAAAVYAIVWALVWILKFVVWLFKWVLTLVDLVLQIAQVIGNAIGGLLKFI